MIDDDLLYPFILSSSVTLLVFLLLILAFQTTKAGKFVVLVMDDVLSSMAKNSGAYYWKLIFAPIFYFIAINNIVSCFGFFPMNSVMIVPMILSGILAITGFTIGIYKKKLNILWDLIPHGIPLVLQPLIFFIELLSLIIKPFTLFFRLFLNIFIGHYITHVICELITNIDGWLGILMLPVSQFILIPLNVIELFTGLLQAYIFINFGSLLIASLTEKH